MKKIKCFDGQIMLIDGDDVDKLQNRSVHYDKDGYPRITIGGKHHKVHRLVMNAPKGSQVDHINRNKLDNRKDNLRFVNHSQNQWNTEKQKGTYKGVSIHKTKYKDKEYIGYLASIQVNGKSYKKRFKTEKEAAIWYNEMAIKHHGGYAVLNQVE